MQAETTCVFCVRYNDDLTCEAFPGGIPAEILNGSVSHKEPYKGDKGVQFKPVN